MTQPIFFESITIPVPKNRILKRLGYRDGITRLSRMQKEDVERYIEEALLIIKLKGAGKRIPVQKETDGVVKLSEGFSFKSKQLISFLEDSSEIVLMAATAGSDIMNAIKKESEANNVTRAVVFDAVASEMTDAALDWIMQYFNQELRRVNLQLTKKRYSCGYGDFLLENQKNIYTILDLKKLGINITESFILTPEKSVTAIAGIKGVRA